MVQHRRKQSFGENHRQENSKAGLCVELLKHQPITLDRFTPPQHNKV